MTTVSMDAPTLVPPAPVAEPGVRRLGFIIDRSIQTKILLVVVGLGLLASPPAYTGAPAQPLRVPRRARHPPGRRPVAAAGRPPGPGHHAARPALTRHADLPAPA